MVHGGGRTSKLSRDLANIRLQLKNRKTRSANPRELEQDEIDALEKKRDGLLIELRSVAKKRSINRINTHTTTEADSVIESQRETNEQVAAMSAVIVEGKIPERVENQAAQERLGQIKQLQVRLDTEAKALREELKEDRVQAAEEREKRMAELRSARNSRAVKAKNSTGAGSTPQSAVVIPRRKTLQLPRGCF